jgi:hypothetical protein
MANQHSNPIKQCPSSRNVHNRPMKLNETLWSMQALSASSQNAGQGVHEVGEGNIDIACRDGGIVGHAVLFGQLQAQLLLS